MTPTRGVFVKFHADTFHMSVSSNGCKRVAHGRCALTSWPEARALKSESARALGHWLFEDILCRWGCITEIVTDNASQYKAALAWIEQKYGIRGIQISAYNSRANGKIERGHWDIRQILAKICEEDMAKWYWFLPYAIWADRVTVKRGLGCSPFFAVTGTHPILPLDVEEATWLVELPDRTLTTEELIAYRAKALAKHQQHVLEMRKRVDKNKLALLRQYEKDHKATIKDYRFKPGDLVLMRNTSIEDHLNRKQKPRWLGPLIVIRQSRGGSYLLSEMDGAMLHRKVAKFRVIPYFARRRISIPKDVHELIDLSEEGLKKLEETEEPVEESAEPSRDLWFDGVHLKGGSNDLSGDDEPLEEEEQGGEDSDSEVEENSRPGRPLRDRTRGEPRKR